MPIILLKTLTFWNFLIYRKICQEKKRSPLENKRLYQSDGKTIPRCPQGDSYL
jgi:hypothetical protein